MRRRDQDRIHHPGGQQRLGGGETREVGERLPPSRIHIGDGRELQPGDLARENIPRMDLTHDAKPDEPKTNVLHGEITPRSRPVPTKMSKLSSH